MNPEVRAASSRVRRVRNDDFTVRRFKFAAVILFFFFTTPSAFCRDLRLIRT